MIEFQDIGQGADLLVKFISSQFGIEIPIEIAYAAIGTPVAALMVIPVVFNIKKIRLAIKRWRHDPKALDDDGRAVVGHIRDDLNKLQSEIMAAAKRGQGKDIEPLLKLLSSRLTKTQQLVDDGADDDVIDQPEVNAVEIDRNGRVRRRVMLRMVRETILANLWAGNFFNEMLQRRHVFRTMFDDVQNKTVIIKVRTPFADMRDNERHPYAIDVKHDNRWVLRIQWDPEDYDTIDIQYCIRGDWEQAILNWNISQKFVPATDEVPPEMLEQPEPPAAVVKLASAG